MRVAASSTGPTSIPLNPRRLARARDARTHGDDRRVGAARRARATASAP